MKTITPSTRHRQALHPQSQPVMPMPTFQTFVGKQMVADLTGADEQGLTAMIAKHAGSKFAGEGATLGGGGASDTSGMSEREKRLAALEAQRRSRWGEGAGGRRADQNFYIDCVCAVQTSGEVVDEQLPERYSPQFQLCLCVTAYIPSTKLQSIGRTCGTST